MGIPHYWVMLPTRSNPVRTVFLVRKFSLTKLDLGQGGAMGIEDAVSLATLLPLGTRVDEIPVRLRLYEKARRPRVDYVLENTRLNGLDEDDMSEKRLTGRCLLARLSFRPVLTSYQLLKWSR